jgi:hypothetical protein
MGDSDEQGSSSVKINVVSWVNVAKFWCRKPSFMNPLM